MTIGTIHNVDVRSGFFEQAFSQDEKDLTKDHDYYSFKADYDALYYKLQYQDGPQIGIEQIQRYPQGDDTDAVSFRLEITDTKANNSVSQVIIDNIPLFKATIFPTRSLQQCARQGGDFNKDTQHCFTYFRLKDICIKVSENPETNQWDLNNTWGTYGCIGPTKEVADYQQIKTNDGNGIDYHFPMILTVNFKVRNGEDPFLVASALTVSTFNFGISSNEMLILGIAFTLIGFITILQPIAYIYKVRADANSIVYQRTTIKDSRNKKIEYSTYKDEPESITERNSNYVPNKNSSLSRNRSRQQNQKLSIKESDIIVDVEDEPYMKNNQKEDY